LIALRVKLNDRPPVTAGLAGDHHVTVPEPVFGQIKEARGFRRFLLRGLVKVRAEWSLVALTHNLLKLHAVAG
jgi:hypothetical protein